MNKIAVLALVSILVVPFVAGFSVDGTNEVNITQGGNGKVDFNVTLTGNTTRVINSTLNITEYPKEELDIALDSSPSKIDVGYSQTHFEGNGSFSMYFLAEDDIGVDNYSVTTTLTNQTDSENMDMNVEVLLPTMTLFEGGIEEGETMYLENNVTIGIAKVKSSGIKFNFTGLSNSKKIVGEGEDYQFNKDGDKFLLGVTNVMPSFDLAEISLEGTKDINVSLTKEKEEEKQESGKVLIERLKNEVMQRGDRFFFRTIVNGSGKRVGASVTFTDMNTGQVIGSTTTKKGDQGVGSVKVEKDIENEKVLASVNPTKVAYNGSTKVYEFAQDYETYKNERTFVIKNVETSVIEGANITGRVETKAGTMANDVLLNVNKPNGATKTINLGKGDSEFMINVTKSGVYTLQAKKDTAYWPSEKVNVEVLPDSDGDSIPDNKDKCPDLKGKKKLDGCVEKETNFVLYEDGKRVSSNDLKKGNSYTLKLEHGNGTVNLTSEMNVGFSDVLSFSDGVATFKAEKDGNYRLSWDGNKKYEKAEVRLDIKSPGLLGVKVGGNLLVPALFVLIILVASYLFIYPGNKRDLLKSGGGSEGPDVGYKPTRKQSSGVEKVSGLKEE